MDFHMVHNFQQSVIYKSICEMYHELTQERQQWDIPVKLMSDNRIPENFT